MSGAPQDQTTAAAGALLEVHSVCAGYVPGHDILVGIDLEVRTGEIVCVIGPNGAGKSTVFKAIYGLVPVRSGRVLCEGTDITNIDPADALATAGIAIVPQLRSTFAQMTVYENLELATCSRAWPTGPASRPGPCRAASSACWRLVAP